MEPFALASFVIGAAVSGIVGNRADDVLCQVMREVTYRLRRGEPAVNHDIQRAVRKAYLQATLAVCETCLQEMGVEPWILRRDLGTLVRQVWRPDKEIRWLDNVRGAVHKELSQLPRAEYEPPPTAAIEQVELLLQPKGTPATERLFELRSALREELLGEVRDKYVKECGEPPECFLKMVQGQDDTTSEAATHLDWFNLLCAFFVHQLKTNERVRSLFEGQLLTRLTVEGVTFEAIERELGNLAGKLTQRFDALDEQLTQLRAGQAQGFEETLDRLDEMLPYAALLPDIRQQQKAILEAQQAIQRELRRRPLYEHYDGQMVADRVQVWIDDRKSFFVGREEALADLNAFVRENRSGRLVVTGGAGIGKTSLLAYWADRLRDAHCFPVCHFFTTRYQDTLPLGNAYRNLLRQLYVYHELENEPLPRPEHVGQAREAIYGLLREKGARPDEPLVIVLDALDEASARFDPFFAPGPLPEGVFILASARAARGQAPDYLEGWTTDAQRLHLERLPPQEVADWLVRVGAGVLYDWVQDRSFVDQVYERTEGFALYLRFLGDELVHAAQAEQDLAKVLARTPRGFAEYVGDQLRRLAHDEGVRQQQGVRSLFALLAVARGPLTAGEVEMLTGLSATWDLPALPWQAARWFAVREDAEATTYAFAHPLLGIEFARVLGREAEQARERLLAYCTRWKEHRSPNDYALRHYAGHLAEAGRWDELHALVATGEERQEWAEARHANDGSYAGYLTDLHLAWRHADEIGATEPAAVGQQVRYALIESSVHSLVKNISPVLLAAGVQYGVLSPQAGLAHALHVPDPKQRGETLNELAPYLLETMLRAALEAARAIENEEGRARALTGLAPRLPTGQRVKVLGEALLAARAIKNDWAYIGVMTALIPHLPEALLGEALVGALVIKDEQTRARALAELGPHLPEGLMGKALAGALAIEGGKFRAEALTKLGPHLPEGLMGETLAGVLTINPEGLRAEALTKLGPHLPAELMEETLAGALTMSYEGFRAQALAGLGPHLPEGLLGEALAGALAIQDERIRAQGLAGLGPHLPERLMGEALAAALVIESEKYRAEALTKLGPHLPAGLVGEALAEARTITGKESRARALMALVPHLLAGERAEVLREALTAALAIKDEETRASVLTRLGPNLPEGQRAEVLREALLAARAIKVEAFRAVSLIALLSHLPQGLMEEALSAVPDIEDEYMRSVALAKLGPHLPEGLLGQALSTALDITEDFSRILALTRLGPYLSEGLRKEALKQALSATAAVLSHPFISPAFRSVESHLPEMPRREAVEEALAAARVIGDEETCKYAQLSLVAHLPAELMEEALTIAQASKDEEIRAHRLTEVGLRLPEHLRGETLGEALSAALSIQDGQRREIALVKLGPHLPQELLRQALVGLLAIEDENAHVWAMTKLGAHLPEELLRQALDGVLAIEDERHRGSALAELGAHLPEELLKQALAGVLAIEDEGHRGSALAKLGPHLPESLLEQARAAALAMEDARHRAYVLAELGAHLPEELLRQALVGVLAIEGERHRGSALAELGPHLPEELLKQALWATLDMVSHVEQMIILTRLEKKLATMPRASLARLWHAILQKQAARERKELLFSLSLLAEILPSLGGEQLAAETFHAIQDVGRWWP